MPPEMAHRIQQMAEQEHRSRSQQIVMLLSRALADTASQNTGSSASTVRAVN